MGQFAEDIVSLWELPSVAEAGTDGGLEPAVLCELLDTPPAEVPADKEEE